MSFTIPRTQKVSPRKDYSDAWRKVRRHKAWLQTVLDGTWMGGIWMETEACEVLQKVAFFIEMCARLLLAVTLEEILGGPTSKSSRRV